MEALVAVSKVRAILRHDHLLAKSTDIAWGPLETDLALWRSIPGLGAEVFTIKLCEDCRAVGAVAFAICGEILGSQLTLRIGFWSSPFTALGLTIHEASQGLSIRARDSQP